MNNQQPSSQSGFFQWIDSLGIKRRDDDRWFAGVASGIAQKANIDSLIVRGIFVVLAVLGGPGLLLYLTAWLLLPDQTGRIHLQQLLRGKATPGVVIAAVIIVVAVFAGIFGNSIWSIFNAWQWDAWSVLGMPGWVGGVFTWIFWIGVFVALAIVVHQMILKKGKGESGTASQDANTATTSFTVNVPAETATDQTNTTTFSSDASTSNSFNNEPSATNASVTNASAVNSEGVTEQPSASTAGDSGTKPDPNASFDERVNNFADQATTVLTDSAEKVSEWGVNVAEKVDQQATDWSKKYAETYERSKPGAGHVLITLAVALIAGAVTTLWVYVSDTVFDSQIVATPLQYFLPGLIVTTAVFAISMVIAGIRGKRSGLVGLFSALGVITLVFTSVMPSGSSFYAVGNARSTAETPAFSMLAGNLEIDLNDYDTAQSRDDYSVNMGLGNIGLVLPDERPATIKVMIAAGRIIDDEDKSANNRSGVFTNHTIVVNQNSKLKPLTVTVRLLAGNVNVSGGNSSLESGGNSTAKELIGWQFGSLTDSHDATEPAVNLKERAL